VKFFLNAEAVSYKILDGSTGSTGDTKATDQTSQVDPNDAFAEAAQDDDVPF